MAPCRGMRAVKKKLAGRRRHVGHHSTAHLARASAAMGPSCATAGQGTEVSPGPGHSATGASAHLDSTMTHGPSASRMRARAVQATADDPGDVRGCRHSAPSVGHHLRPRDFWANQL
eukprot:15450672-Alexandrium_andersonii.AAC.1